MKEDTFFILNCCLHFSINCGSRVILAQCPRLYRCYNGLLAQELVFGAGGLKTLIFTGF